MRLGAGGGVLVNDTGLGGLVHGGDVGARGGFGGLEFTGLLGGEKLLVKGLQAGLGRLVAGGEASRFAGGFDSGFRVGHGGLKVKAGQKPKPARLSQGHFRSALRPES